MVEYNPNWDRWIHASIGYRISTVAESNGFPLIIQGIDDPYADFKRSPHRAELAVNGPSVEQQHGMWRLLVDIYLFMYSMMGEAGTDRHTMLRMMGVFQRELNQPISVFRFGTGPEDDQGFVACLLVRDESGGGVKSHHFGEVNPTDRIKQGAIDAKYHAYMR